VSIMPEEDYADGYVPAASILPIADIRTLEAAFLTGVEMAI